MSPRWPTLFSIANAMRAELASQPVNPGEHYFRRYRNVQRNVELELWHDGDGSWKLIIKRLGTLPDAGSVAFCRAAFQVPEEAEESVFVRREMSQKITDTDPVIYHGLTLRWRESDRAENAYLDPSGEAESRTMPLR